jgi:acyl-ACP thioesterase
MDAPRRLEHHYRVRFDEADVDGHLRPSGILRYTQDMAWRHSEEGGFDRAWYDARAMHWLVRNVSLRIRETATQGDVLSIATEVVGWRQVWARRRTEMRRRARGGDHEPIAVVDTDWVLLGVDGRPARVPPEVARYFTPGQRFSRIRIDLPTPTDDPTTLSTRVRPIDVDPLRHMNNAAYLDFVDDALARMPGVADRGRPCGYEVGYLRAALPDSAIVVACWPVDDGSVACRISDADGLELTRVLVSWSGA